MYQELNDYLAYQGMKYIKPEKAGSLQAEMIRFKACGQAARTVFIHLSKALVAEVSPFEMVRVSNWASQAQLGRPHFWCYYKQAEDAQDDVAIAIRLYGERDDFGISVEVSFVENKKSEDTFAKQHRVLDIPIVSPLYYFAQKNGVSSRVSGTEDNRRKLKEAIASGEVRKVLVKYDIPLTTDTTLSDLVKKLSDGFQKVLPYYNQTKNVKETS